MTVAFVCCWGMNAVNVTCLLSDEVDFQETERQVLRSFGIVTQSLKADQIHVEVFVLRGCHAVYIGSFFYRFFRKAYLSNIKVSSIPWRMPFLYSLTVEHRTDTLFRKVGKKKETTKISCAISQQSEGLSYTVAGT